MKLENKTVAAKIWNLSTETPYKKGDVATC